MTVRLSVNVDHIATLRQARGVAYPDPVVAARLAEEAGADGITVHLRGDRRHIQEQDVHRLREAVRGRLNLEVAVSDEMLAIAEEVRPHQVTLVPERPDEITTEGGIDVQACGAQVVRAARRLTAAGIAVSIFLDPNPLQIDRLAEHAAGPVAGFEVNTDRYTRALESERPRELAAVAEAAEYGAALGFRIYAGHGLTAANVGPVAALPQVEELNVGHWLVSRATLVGLQAAVREMLAAIAA
jgi:pyridoxine 5-phosphate synthase